jgi:predicted RNase H-like HicB family nuclease
MVDKTMTPTYRVTYEHDSNGLWFVRCPDIQGAHSHGRTIASARNHIHEAIALVLDLPEGTRLDFDEQFELGDSRVETALAHARQLRNQAVELDEQARTATLDAIATVKASEESLSMRDLAELVGLSHQRIQQISTGIT